MNLRIRGILLFTCILTALWANGQVILIKSATLKTEVRTGGYHDGNSGFIDLRYQIENNTGDTLAFIPYYNNVIMEGYKMPLMLIQSQQKTSTCEAKYEPSPPGERMQFFTFDEKSILVLPPGASSALFQTSEYVDYNFCTNKELKITLQLKYYLPIKSTYKLSSENEALRRMIDLLNHVTEGTNACMDESLKSRVAQKIKDLEQTISNNQYSMDMLEKIAGYPLFTGAMTSNVIEPVRITEKRP